MRTTRTAVAVVLSTTLSAGLLAGCGMFGRSDPEPTGTDDTARTDPGGNGGEEEPTGPTPQEISEQLISTTVERDDDAPAVATATGADAGGAAVTLDVVSVQRLEDSTLVTFRLSGDPGTSLAGPGGFGTAEHDSLNFARTLYLVDDTVTLTRYLPLQFDDYRPACTCPYMPFELSATPQTFTALYPALPDGVATVDLAASDMVTVADAPVTG